MGSMAIESRGVELSVQDEAPSAPPDLRTGARRGQVPRLSGPHRIVLLAVVLCCAVIVKDAWLADDAYITFRTVDNFVSGYGLVWNVGERVQSYTHPLWMLLLSGAYFLHRDIYWSSLLLCFAASFAAIAVLAFGIARTPRMAILGVALLAASKSFMDFSTSGLENPLTHLLLALFALVYWRMRTGRRRLLLLSLLAGLATFNRMDTILLYVPALLYAAHITLRASMLAADAPSGTLHRAAALLTPVARCAGTLALGFVPFFLWESFALWYYGFPFPNTAYAKLHTGVPFTAQLVQGLHYFSSSSIFDPVLFIGLLGSLLLIAAARRRPSLALAAGIPLYLLYVLLIGGDFMAGRFLTAPFLSAVLIFAHDPLPDRASGWLRPFARFHWRHALVAVLAFGVLVLNSRWLPDYHTLMGIDPHGVADERSFYVNSTGIFAIGFGPTIPHSDWSDWAQQGLALHGSGRTVVFYNVGFYGFMAGPTVHIVDGFALCDPLLARLPALPNARVGHYWRAIPAGYLATLETGANQIADPGLALYYQKLQVLTQGNLWDPSRWSAIWQFNTGAYDYLLASYGTDQASP